MHTCATGIIISPEINSEKNSSRLPIYLIECACQEHATREETYRVKTCSIDGSFKTTVHSWIVALSIVLIVTH